MGERVSLLALHLLAEMEQATVSLNITSLTLLNPQFPSTSPPVSPQVRARVRKMWLSNEFEMFIYIFMIQYWIAAALLKVTVAF